MSSIDRCGNSGHLRRLHAQKMFVDEKSDMVKGFDCATRNENALDSKAALVEEALDCGSSVMPMTEVPRRIKQ
jgi:hypothetical protein